MVLGVPCQHMVRVQHFAHVAADGPRTVRPNVKVPTTRDGRHLGQVTRSYRCFPSIFSYRDGDRRCQRVQPWNNGCLVRAGYPVQPVGCLGPRPIDGPYTGHQRPGQGLAGRVVARVVVADGFFVRHDDGVVGSVSCAVRGPVRTKRMVVLKHFGGREGHWTATTSRGRPRLL